MTFVASPVITASDDLSAVAQDILDNDLKNKLKEFTLESDLAAGFSTGADDSSIFTNIDDPEAVLLINELSDYLSQFDISVYYGELDSDKFFSFNSSDTYQFQSITKAFYSHYLYKFLSTEEISATLPMTSEARLFAYYGGVAEFPNGTELEIPYLIKRAIRESDVAAYNLVFDAFGVDGFNDYASELGSGLTLTTANGMGRFSNGTVRDAAVFLHDIWENRDGSGTVILDHMTNCIYNGLISAAVRDYKVAHKYGYGEENNGFNDAAIVMTDSPYVLIILSRLPGTIDNNNYPFYVTSSTALKINLLLHPVQ